MSLDDVTRAPDTAATRPTTMPRVSLLRRGADRHVLLMILAFVASVVGTRLYLDAAGYPQIGGGDIHVAHVLWGGLLLILAAVLVLILDGERALAVGSLLAGAGTGLFIDEVGKFITASNDYFYPLAAPLIYGLVLTLVLVLLALRRRPDAGSLVSAPDAVARLEAGLLPRRRARRLLALALAIYGLAWVAAMALVALIGPDVLRELVDELIRQSTSRVEHPTEAIYYALEAGILGGCGLLLIAAAAILAAGREWAGTTLALVGLALALTAGGVVSLYVEQISAIGTTLTSALLLLAVLRFRGRFLEAPTPR